MNSYTFTFPYANIRPRLSPNGDSVASSAPPCASNFERHKVNSARIVRRRWGKPRKSKGYGFVDAEARQQSLIGGASHLSSNRFAQNTSFHRNPYNTAYAAQDISKENYIGGSVYMAVMEDWF
ncbi:hypothetical protein PHLCEN_2v1803 [Hermanssonia centrifuga]|uniref:Uncharacterized protein n=1 Tax=Hermanssonia centrifuga TaxID=98765 RepID=A0A2R6RVW4_9APHY|nr:hypothetical protein PHLCEN_2v1803 [Hermanssonia centrifuga]